MKKTTRRKVHRDRSDKGLRHFVRGITDSDVTHEIVQHDGS
jgi:hypothetical protein